MSNRQERGAFALLVVGGLLVGLGLSADAPTGGHLGVSAAAVATKARAAAVDKAEVAPVDDDRREEHRSAEEESAAPPPAPAEPQRLAIPSLGVDAPVVAIAAEGLLLTPPSDPQLVGWWSAGARPGAEHGTAILAGHTVSRGGGVFDDLDQMQPGQQFEIHSGQSRLSFQVTSVTVYRKASLAEHAAEIFDQGIAGRVALVTCEDWDGTQYLSNAVVIAEPVG